VQGGGKKRYQANWASLDSRPNPEWYRDAKFGIFIHWGVYSVPAWRPKGSYAEWYWRALHDKSDTTWQFHQANYGKDFTYAEFAPLFKAELFDPDQWATLFRRAGARYVVLTSKHHDGYCLWPSAQSWNWNSVDVGPHRDLLGDLTAAGRKQGLKMGFYYSLYEWFNPLYQTDVQRYVAEHMLPQFKDVVTRYKPSIIFADGEWEHPSKVWRSEEFLAWLFNDSPAPDDVVINDRWGSDTRFRHGGYFSTEYANIATLKSGRLQKRGWEECRGIGASFGYNRNETVEDYQSGDALIRMLIDIVSKGGNLLLDIGPASDGRIPVIMQERLLQIGAWLQTNGEAIYATRPYRTFGEGEAVRFTRSKNRRFVYAIHTRPLGQTLRLQSVLPKAGTSIRVLGDTLALPWRVQDGALEIDIPDEVRLRSAATAAVAFRIEAVPYVEPPRIRVDKTISENKPIRVALECATPSADIRYTLDGREPGPDSPQYRKAFKLKRSALLQARAFKDGYLASLVASRELSIVDPKRNGVRFRYYEGDWSVLPDFASLQPVRGGKVYEISLKGTGHRGDHFGIEYEAEIEIARGGKYTFFTESDDGSKLFIDGELVVDNDGLHGQREASGRITLQPGRHRLRVQFFEKDGGESLAVSYQGPGIPKQPIPAHVLYRGAMGF